MYKRQPHSPLAIVRLFLTSMSLVIFCLLFSLVDYVPIKGEIKKGIPIGKEKMKLSLFANQSI